MDFIGENWRLLLAVGLLISLILWETLFPFLALFRGAPGERGRHSGRNFLLGVINAVFNATVAFGLWLWISTWAARNGFGVLNLLELPRWLEIVLAVLLIDCWMYWWHRINHMFPLLWRVHRVHHSDPCMDVSTAYRFHFGEMLLSALARLPVIALCGIELWQLVAFEAALFANVQIQHANISLSPRVDRWLRALVVSPFMHKVHHSDLQAETDSNYSSVFSWWDRLFGSFRMRADPENIRFGLREFREPDDQSVRGLLLTPMRSDSSFRAADGRSTKTDNIDT
ncbi:MAG: sterol desaturase/sphingolipid hydroxylase (fatty acid hydroxylase superfamily) [Yoonia sp.]|jgi:sterol desaturase/sphingolipid hydroxylase (fatty acid hydroxylase superfamily)